MGEFFALLDLADDLAGAAEALNHLLAFLAPACGVVAFLEELIQFVGAVHVFEELALHLVLGESGMGLVCLVVAGFGDTY